MTSYSSLIHKIERNEKKTLMGEQQINQTLNNDWTMINFISDKSIL